MREQVGIYSIRICYRRKPPDLSAQPPLISEFGIEGRIPQTGIGIKLPESGGSGSAPSRVELSKPLKTSQQIYDEAMQQGVGLEELAKLGRELREAEQREQREQRLTR